MSNATVWKLAVAVSVIGLSSSLSLSDQIDCLGSPTDCTDAISKTFIDGGNQHWSPSIFESMSAEYMARRIKKEFIKEKDQKTPKKPPATADELPFKKPTQGERPELEYLPDKD